MASEWHEQMVDKILDDYSAEAAVRRPFQQMTVDPTYLLMIIDRARQVQRPHVHHFTCLCGAKCEPAPDLSQAPTA